MNEYTSVVKLLTPVLSRGRAFEPGRDAGASPLAKEIAYGVLRDYFRLDAIVSMLVKKPLGDKHQDIQVLLLAGIYSVDAIRRPDYASVNAAVDAARGLGKQWGAGLVNGVLRNYLRDRERIAASIAKRAPVQSGHPGWLVRSISRDWPEVAADIIAANNEQAPMTLRVNARQGNRDAYLQLLADAGIEAHAGELADTAIYLTTPVGVDRLPGFDDGRVSVQDEASQLAASVVAPAAGDRVLDACAAPGGKTCHLLEYQQDIDLTAIDIDENRLDQVRDNLRRLSLSCHVAASDLADFDHDGATFDRILLDAPCSATGVIRRHPDIKLLRRKSDIAKLVEAQQTLVRAAWELLAGGGVLVYSTCSVLRAENDEVVSQFLEETPDASLSTIDADWGHATRFGRQLLPTSNAHDGFYFARLVKAA